MFSQLCDRNTQSGDASDHNPASCVSFICTRSCLHTLRMELHMNEEELLIFLHCMLTS